MQKPSGKAPRSVLLIATRQIGDVLLTTPLLHSMRLAWPGATIDVLVYRNKGGMLQGNPDCDHVIESEEHPSLSGYWHLIKRMFRKYDLAVTTQAGDRAYQYAFVAAKKRIGLMSDMRTQAAWKRMVCSAWIELDNLHTHTVVQNTLLADCMGIEKHHDVIPPADANADQALDRLLGSNWRSQDNVVLHPFPMWRYKRWTETGWQALAQYLIAAGKHVVITGGGGEEELAYCTRLAAQFDRHAISLAGKTSFGIMSTLLTQASAYIGPDTAATHLAAACGTPTLALYGPSNPVKWGPWPKGCAVTPSPWKMSAPYQRHGNVLLLQGEGSCVPCREEGCDRHRNSESRCLNELSPGRVISAYESLMRT